MKKLIVAAPLVFACLFCVGAGLSGRSRVEFLGFTIQTLESQSRDAAYTPLIMSLPPSDGFAPNVNVMIQPYAGTMDEYVSLSKKQFGDANFQVIKEIRSDQSLFVVEYKGDIDGRKLHWYAKASLLGKTVYLVTATATESQWPTASPKLKTCVDSFALNVN